MFSPDAWFAGEKSRTGAVEAWLIRLGMKAAVDQAMTQRLLKRLLRMNRVPVALSSASSSGTAGFVS